MTFSDECADQFPSLHYLAPGNPLLRHLIETWKRTSDVPERLIKFAEPDSQSSRPIVSGWGRDGTIHVVAEDGAHAKAYPVSDLSDWYDDFVTNREEYTEE